MMRISTVNAGDAAHYVFNSSTLNDRAIFYSVFPTVVTALTRISIITIIARDKII